MMSTSGASLCLVYVMGPVNILLLVKIGKGLNNAVLCGTKLGITPLSSLNWKNY